MLLLISEYRGAFDLFLKRYRLMEEDELPAVAPVGSEKTKDGQNIVINIDLGLNKRKQIYKVKPFLVQLTVTALLSGDELLYRELRDTDSSADELIALVESGRRIDGERTALAEYYIQVAELLVGLKGTTKLLDAWATAARGTQAALSIADALLRQNLWISAAERYETAAEESTSSDVRSLALYGAMKARHLTSEYKKSAEHLLEAERLGIEPDKLYDYASWISEKEVKDAELRGSMRAKAGELNKLDRDMWGRAVDEYGEAHKDDVKNLIEEERQKRSSQEITV